MNTPNFCFYYQAHVVPKDCWFLAGVLRSFEHLCFDRTIDKEHSVFEFFVPLEHVEIFEEIMRNFEKHDVIRDLRKMDNRLFNPDEKV